MRYYYFILLSFTLSCRAEPDKLNTDPPSDTVVADPVIADSIVTVHKDSTMPAKIVAYAKTLLGTPYQFGCSAPSTGFDCSGFINYVFNHFNIEVPRSSEGFTNEGSPIPLENSQPGDLILFTGTNSKIRTVGHIGLVVTNDTAGISFIHSSSGKENAVIITELDERYMARFVKVIRIIQ